MHLVPKKVDYSYELPKSMITFASILHNSFLSMHLMRQENKSRKYIDKPWFLQLLPWRVFYKSCWEHNLSFG